MGDHCHQFICVFISVSGCSIYVASRDLLLIFLRPNQTEYVKMNSLNNSCFLLQVKYIAMIEELQDADMGGLPENGYSRAVIRTCKYIMDC